MQIAKKVRLYPNKTMLAVLDNLCDYRRYCWKNERMRLARPLRSNPLEALGECHCHYPVKDMGIHLSTNVRNKIDNDVRA